MDYLDPSALEPGDLSIALFPAATINSASSRLRCFGLGRELAALGYHVGIGVDANDPPHILYVQKIVNAAVLQQAQLVRDSGGLVIYDIDDYGPEALGALKADAHTFHQFMALVSIVVVDTETRAEVFRKEPGFTDVAQLWVVPDPIDYIESSTRDSPRPHKKPGQKLRACWFGNAPNAVPALPYLVALAAADEVADVSVMLNKEYVDYFRTSFPQLATSAWALETFPAQLRATDFCVLIHASTFEGVQKSNNKMLAALALGVVPFVSRTPAYAETAERMGMPELIVDSPQDVLDRLQPEVFNGILDRLNGAHCTNQLLQYFPAASAKIFSDNLMAFLKT